jgi:septum formation protein maf
VETSTHKAVEVYQRLVRESPENPPDLVIGADTVLVDEGQVLEKPVDATDNLRMLAELRGRSCTVITGVALVHPVLQSPGYHVRTICERTRIHFGDVSSALLKAYVDSGEGMGRAGGFAIQGRGSLLIRAIEGDYNNVVGFPLYSVFELLHDLVENGELDLEGLGD